MVPVEGFMYPNEVELQWSVLIVLYPFLTGLVAGAFILASLERVFRVEAVKPTYRLALLTALAFLLVAPLPLQLHLGHPERSFEMYLTPPLLCDGNVRIRLPLVPDGRSGHRDMARLPRRHRRRSRKSARAGLRRLSPDDARIHQREPALAGHRQSRRMGHHDHRNPVRFSVARLRRIYFRIGEGESVVVDAAHARRISVLRHRFRYRRGDAPVYAVDLDSARSLIDMPCIDTIARYLLYTFIIDFSLEMLDLIHRIYEADESFRSLDFMVHTRL